MRFIDREVEAEYTDEYGVGPLIGFYGCRYQVWSVETGSTLCLAAGGGVLFTRDQFRLANGYPNGFWGWGVEDHDLLNRLECVGLRLDRRHWHGKLDCGTPQITARARQSDSDEGST